MKTFKSLTMLCFLLIGINHSVKAQPTLMHFEKGCHYLHPTTEDDKYVEDPSLEADSIFNKILAAAFIPKGKIILKMSNVENALATESGGIKYILYSQNFLKNLKRTPDDIWVIYSVFAHEVGHHHLGHKLNESNPVQRKEDELAADKFSGEILNSLGASEDEAIAAIMSFVKKYPQSDTYPPISARVDHILNGWKKKNEELINRYGKHPTIIVEEIKPTFGQKGYGKSNKAENVHAVVYKDRIEFTFGTNLKAGTSDEYIPFIVVDSDSNLRPITLKWKRGRDKLGNENKVIWEFKKDGLSDTQAKRPEELGIVIFKTKKIPRKVKSWNWIGSGLLVAGGGYFGLVKGPEDMDTACDLYDSYASIRNPSDPFYSELSRPDILNKSEDDYKFARNWETIGGNVVLVGGGIWMVVNIIKQRRSKKGRLYAQLEPLLQIDPIVYVEGGGGFSIQYTF